jgi:DNA-directed RNA polymerase sigma subunit (sigma70/sigma32)
MTFSQRDTCTDIWEYPDLWEPDRELQRRHIVKAFDQAIAKLSTMESAVIRLNYGFDGHPQTLRAAAETLRISHSDAIAFSRKARRKLAQDWQFRRIINSFIY